MFARVFLILALWVGLGVTQASNPDCALSDSACQDTGSGSLFSGQDFDGNDPAIAESPASPLTPAGLAPAGAISMAVLTLRLPHPYRAQAPPLN